MNGYATSITYHPNGLLNRITHANGMTETQQVDANGMARPARIIATGSQGSWNSGLYSYDGSGNIASIGGDVFVYDALNRLTSATLGTSASGAAQGYAFDNYGNITTLGSRSFKVGTRTNRITSASYDRTGNQLTSGSGATLQHYQFNALNRLSTHQTTGDARGFVYTVDGERLLEIDFSTDPWEEVWTIRDLAGRVLRQWRRSGDSWMWSKDYIYRGSRLLASEEPEGTKHFHLDHLGTPRLITDGSGVVGRHAYFPFGEEVSDPGQNAERMKFTGHERDLVGAGIEDDLDYMHARYCSPMAGRFLSVDPKRMGKPVAGQSWNRYAYTEGNPLKYVDPDGRQPTGGAFAFERDARAVLDGRMTSQEFQERNAARGAAPLALVSLTAPGPEDVALGVAVITKLGSRIAARATGFFKRIFGGKRQPLHEIADEIRTSGHPIAANRRTIAVGEDAQGGLHVGSSNGLDAGQRAAAERLGVHSVPSRPGLHAEEELLEGVDDLRAVGTSQRLPCGPSEHDCAGQLAKRGITVTNPGG